MEGSEEALEVFRMVRMQFQVVRGLAEVAEDGESAPPQDAVLSTVANYRQ